MELKRREFIAGAAVAGLSAFACGLAGCAAPRGNDAPAAQSTDSGDKPEAFEAAETVETDIVIVGAGISGLAAAVQAGHNKDRVIVLEASPTPGGAGGVEGIFGWNSPIQRELGIDFSKSEVLTAEVKKNNYVTDGERWNDTIKASGENIQWLLEQGAEFTGVVDNYHDTCLYDTFHWWKGGHASEGYISPMLAKAEALGVTFRTKTRAKALIVNESTVTGLYAELEDGSILQVNAGAVVLAAGGFVGNTELLLSQMNITERDMAKKCLEVAALMNRVGDGVLMARDIGAQLYPNTCMEGWSQPANLPIGDASMYHGTPVGDSGLMYDFLSPLLFAGTSIWVNENAQRFIDESSALTEIERTFPARKYYKDHYQIFDQATLDTFIGDDAAVESAFKQLRELNPDSILESNEIEGLGDLVGIDAAALASAIEEYNAYCAQGADDDFAKPAEFLAALEHAPYYVYRNEICGDATMGGVCVDRSFRALTPQKDPIPGLYIIGVDGCMLYNGVYSISIGGTACCNSINSGRTSVNHAHDYLKSA